MFTHPAYTTDMKSFNLFSLKHAVTESPIVTMFSMSDDYCPGLMLLIVLSSSQVCLITLHLSSPRAVQDNLRRIS